MNNKQRTKRQYLLRKLRKTVKVLAQRNHRFEMYHDIYTRQSSKLVKWLKQSDMIQFCVHDDIGDIAGVIRQFIIQQGFKRKDHKIIVAQEENLDGELNTLVFVDNKKIATMLRMKI